MAEGFSFYAVAEISTTVELCIEETINLIEKDDCLVFLNYSKNLFVADLKGYVNESKKKKDEPLYEETNKTIYLVDECLAANESGLLARLIEKIETQVTMDDDIEDRDFMPRLEGYDALLSSFACELLAIGFSKRYLYKFFFSFKKNRRGLSFDDAFAEMKAKFLELKQLSFHVVIKISFKHANNAQAASKASEYLNDEIPEELKKNVGTYKSFKTKKKNVLFYIEEVEALDAYMAVRNAHDHLSKLLDYKQDVISDYTLPGYALAFLHKGERDFVSSEKFFELDNGGQFLKDVGNLLYAKLEIIDSSSKIVTDVKDRITAALRHLRIGDGQVELEQQFINYWVALEFIFASSSSKDNTYSRIKENLVNILTACYVKRNLLYLENWMRREGVLTDGDDLIEKINGDDLIGTEILLKYRMKRMKSHLQHKDKVKKYINKHRAHLSQHISRIYRLRNELVHEAALKQDIENVASNLRFYLVFVLNQMIDYFSEVTANTKQRSTLQFFWNYDKCLKSILSAGNIDDTVSAIKCIHIAKSYIV